MPTTTLHYIHDPLCGWCYGAAPLVKAAREILPVIPHGGGMMTGARRQKVTAQLREYVKLHDAQMALRSGQPFGESYLDGLLRDTEAMFDSEPPTAAVLAAEALAGRGRAGAHPADPGLHGAGGRPRFPQLRTRIGGRLHAHRARESSGARGGFPGLAARSGARGRRACRRRGLRLRCRQLYCLEGDSRMKTNLQVLSEHCAASARQDLAAMMADVSPEASWTEMAGFP
jgi:hypothetical protein